MLELITTILAVLTGLSVFKKLNLFCRLLFFQAFIYLISDLCGYYIFHNNNSWLYNILIFIETALLLAAAQAYFNSAESRFMLLVSFSFFAIVYAANIYYNAGGIRKFAVYAAIAEGVIITCVYAVILCAEFMKATALPVKMPVVCIALGMLFYFAAGIPGLSATIGNAQQDKTLVKTIFVNTVVLLAGFRYLFLMIAFLLLKNDETSEHPSVGRSGI